MQIAPSINLFFQLPKAESYCQECGGTGLIERREVPPAKFAIEAYETMYPCPYCPAGDRIRPAWEAGKSSA